MPRAVPLAAVSGAALFQNFFRLSDAPVLFDEPLYAEMGWRYVHWGTLSEAARSPRASNFEHPPLAKLLFGLGQLVAGSPSLTAARAAGAVCTVVSAALGWWLARVAGRWTGLLAGGLLALLPLTVFPQVTPFGRTAMLDPVAELFMVVSVVCAWSWFSSSGRRAWVLALATGAAVGLSAASKENGFLGVVGPVVVGLFWSRPSGSASGPGSRRSRPSSRRPRWCSCAATCPSGIRSAASPTCSRSRRGIRSSVIRSVSPDR